MVLLAYVLRPVADVPAIGAQAAGVVQRGQLNGVLQDGGGHARHHLRCIDQTILEEEGWKRRLVSQIILEEEGWKRRLVSQTILEEALG
jgi:hypothetical protein